MTIIELADVELSEGVAYLVGLLFPLLIDKQEIIDTFHKRKYIAGCVNHNDVSNEDLAYHFKEVFNLFKRCNLNKVDIKNNAKDPAKKFDFSCSPKKGFTCLIETTGVSIEITERILREKVDAIKNSTAENRRMFTRACFDGRGSWDSTLHMFSVDIDRKERRRDQFLLQQISESVIGEKSIQLNQREWNHKKHDQMRIRKDFIRTFLNNVGLYSIARKNILLNGLANIGR